jgi:hypothetical protein
MLELDPASYVLGVNRPGFVEVSLVELTAGPALNRTGAGPHPSLSPRTGCCRERWFEKLAGPRPTVRRTRVPPVGTSTSTSPLEAVPVLISEVDFV